MDEIKCFTVIDSKNGWRVHYSAELDKFLIAAFSTFDFCSIADCKVAEVPDAFWFLLRLRPIASKLSNLAMAVVEEHVS